MNKTYVTKQDSKGRDLYYVVEDGKMKRISKGAYEAGQVCDDQQSIELETAITVVNTEVSEETAIETTETTATATEDVMSAIAEAALEAVKSIIKATGNVNADKVRAQYKKNCVLINYRNCMVCSLVFNDDHAVAAVRFMGNTLETRKEATIYEPCDLSTRENEIISQVTFIDWWYKNPVKKAV